MESEDGEIIKANMSLETRMPICKKCKKFLSIKFHNYINLSLDCQCQDINGMSTKEFENEFLCQKRTKKDESNKDKNNIVLKNVPLEIGESIESNSTSKFELNEKTINTQSNSNDKKENNESILKNNLKGFNTIINTDLKESEEANDNMSSTYNEIDLEEKKVNENYIDIKEEDLCKCIRHNKNKFLKYCVDCNIDLCSECLDMESDVYSNTNIKNKKHENHTKVPLEEIKDKFDEIDELLEKTIKNEKIDQNNKFNLEIIFNIIKSCMNNYTKYKCYNLYKSIENIKLFLEKINDNESDIETFEKVYKNHLRISSEEKLLELIYFSSNMSSINIQYEEKIDMSIFYKRDFGQLEELTLVGNHIKDISSLLDNSFPKLKILNLEVNYLDSSIIPILRKLYLPELTDLNLYKNKITNVEIFDLIKGFKKLKLFYIGENKFKNDGGNTFYEFPESLEEFGLTGNFEGEDINFVKRLGIGNLKIFYISRNKITNLKSLQNINFLQLGEFWAISNYITDIKEIMNINNKKSLWKINLKQNKISNFQELFNIIDYFPNLEILNLTDSGIEEKEAEEMKRKIKEKREKDLNIILND